MECRDRGVHERMGAGAKIKCREQGSSARKACNVCARQGESACASYLPGPYLPPCVGALIARLLLPGVSRPPPPPPLVTPLQGFISTEPTECAQLSCSRPHISSKFGHKQYCTNQCIPPGSSGRVVLGREVPQHLGASCGTQALGADVVLRGRARVEGGVNWQCTAAQSRWSQALGADLVLRGYGNAYSLPCALYPKPSVGCQWHPAPHLDSYRHTGQQRQVGRSMVCNVCVQLTRLQAGQAFTHVCHALR